jgi:hypothetical protein
MPAIASRPWARVLYADNDTHFCVFLPFAERLIRKLVCPFAIVDVKKPRPALVGTGSLALVVRSRLP